MKKRGQTGIEYMIIVGFVTFAIMSALVLAIYYSDQVKDKIRLNQAESFAVQLINSAEAVFFAGEPSKSSVKLYLPKGVQSIEINSDNIVMSVQLSSGVSKRLYESSVPLNGAISSSEGLKKLIIEAKEDFVQIG